jgi:Family of unknown function (DUF6445)
VNDLFCVVDDFVADPDAVRDSALKAGFGTWRPSKGEVGSSVYDGMGFWGNHSVLLRSLAGSLGCPVYPNDMFFRVTNEDTEAAYIHSDRESGDFTCIVYLSRHEDSGTGFYRHRESQFIRMPSFAELAAVGEFERLKVQMVEGHAKDWEQIAFVEGLYNRALIFDAPRFHGRHPKHGFGTTIDAGRMVWACHFYL